MKKISALRSKPTCLLMHTPRKQGSLDCNLVCLTLKPTFAIKLHDFPKVSTNKISNFHDILKLQSQE